MTRDLVWDGCLDVRDLGGLPTEDGGTTRFGSIIRADNVRKLTTAGWAALSAYGVGTIVDLRLSAELADDPPRDLDLDVRHVPGFDGSSAPAAAMRGVLEELERTDGGVEGYLRGGGIDHATLDRARARLRTGT